MTLNTAIDDLYHSILELIEDLMELDPPPETPEGQMLQRLAAAVEEYEKVAYPITEFHDENYRSDEGNKGFDQESGGLAREGRQTL